MLIWFHKIPFYHLNKRILWKLFLLYTDDLISQQYKKMFSRKIRLVAIRSGFYTLDFYKVWLRLLNVWKLKSEQNRSQIFLVK